MATFGRISIVVASTGMLAILAGCFSHKGSKPTPASSVAAAEPSAAASAPAGAPIATTSPGSFQGGFQGIECGSAPGPDMKLINTKGDVSFYVRPKDPKHIDRGLLKAETYRYYRNQFEGVLLETTGAANSSEMLDHFERIIGPGTQSPSQPTKFVWSDRNLQVIFEQDPRSGDASTVVGCNIVEQQHKADLMAQGNH
jgi:hypothetical protein